MKKLINTLFPYRLYLHMLQLEGYNNSRFLKWVIKNFSTRTTLNKKPLVYTSRIKIIILISFFILGLVMYLVSCFSKSLAVILPVVLMMQPYVLIVFSNIVFKPYEWFRLTYEIYKTKKKISSLKKLHVVGIAGSFGKTSVKDILFHLLKSKYKVLKTPLSYNTILGISAVVDLELDDTYDYFLCELGEFKKGDVTMLCNMVMPEYGIMTGINDQHLERFKNINNTISCIFEIADYLKSKKQKTVANGANAYILDEIKKRNSDDFIIYSANGGEFTSSVISFSEYGTKFSLGHRGDMYTLETPLLGYAHMNNLIGGLTLALQLGVSIEILVEQVKTLPLIPHRFEQKLMPNNILLIDNAFSSNTDSFRESLKTLGGFLRKNKILVTPGVVELGEKSNASHEEFGKMANDYCTHIVLVGKTDRTKSLALHISKEKLIWISDIKDIWNSLEEYHFKPEETVVLLENDLPDNY